jgi:hypothetical protein
MCWSLRTGFTPKQVDRSQRGFIFANKCVIQTELGEATPERGAADLRSRVEGLGLGRRCSCY